MVPEPRGDLRALSPDAQCDSGPTPEGRWQQREHAGEHFVQSNAQRVEVAAGIDRPIHAPGLFRGHVGECAGNNFGRRGCLALTWHFGRDAKAGEPYVSGG
jgi:hypothetical protein